MLSAGIIVWVPDPAGDITTSTVVAAELLFETHIDFTTALVAAGTVKTVVDVALTKGTRYRL